MQNENFICENVPIPYVLTCEILVKADLEYDKKSAKR